MTVEVKYCVVCGQGSTREDWQAKKVVACDSHSKEEIDKAIVKASPKEAAPAPTKAN